MIEFFRKTIERARLWQQTTFPVRTVVIFGEDNQERQFLIFGPPLKKIYQTVDAVLAREEARSARRTAGAVAHWFPSGSGVGSGMARLADRMAAQEKEANQMIRRTHALVVRVPSFPRFHR